VGTIENSSGDTLIECLRDPTRAATLSREAAKALWLQINNLGAHLMTRWASPDDSAIDEVVLTVAQAAEFAHLSQSFLYDHAKRLPCAFRAGRSWRFHKKDLLQDIAALGDRPRSDAFGEPTANRRKPALPQGARRFRAASAH
jgi:helix-turn-helix protein